MNASTADVLKSLAHAAADVRRRDLEVMANFRSFPRMLWSKAKNQDIAFAQRQVADAYRQIRASAEQEKRRSSAGSDLCLLADAIVAYATGGIEVAESYVKIAEFMDLHAIRSPIRALYYGFRWSRGVKKTEKRMDLSSARIKDLWPHE